MKIDYTVSTASEIALVHNALLRHPQELFHQVLVLDTCNSTMDVCAAAMQGAALPFSTIRDAVFSPGHIVLSKNQTSARGRNGRVWVSAKHDGLWMTYGLSTDRAPLKLSGITLVIGLTLQAALSALGILSTLKWPNDIYVDDNTHPPRKLAGILVETARRNGVSDTDIRIGIGINIETPPDPQFSCIGLSDILDNMPDRYELLAKFTAQLANDLQQFFASGFQPFIDIWERQSGMVGLQITIEDSGSSLTGVVKGLSHTGALLITTASGNERTISSGELRIRYATGD